MDSVIDQMLSQHGSNTLYAQAKSDVLPFIRNPAALDMWSKAFFQSITQDLKAL